MENAIYAGLSRAVALQRDMDTVSNNIANMNTPGFRAHYMMFQEYIEKPRGILDPLSMVLDYGQWMSNRPGSLQMTGNETDVAIQGKGFFGVDLNGETHYTRAGNFIVNPQGTLVTPDGHPVASTGGAPITIPEGTTEIRIAEDGTISNQDGPIDQLMVKEFENVNMLDPVGDSLYRARDGATEVDAGQNRIVQGGIEGSNVNAIGEMTRMIDVHRAYQSTHRMLQNEHDRQRTMIQRMTRTS